MTPQPPPAWHKCKCGKEIQGANNCVDCQEDVDTTPPAELREIVRTILFKIGSHPNYIVFADANMRKEVEQTLEEYLASLIHSRERAAVEEQDLMHPKVQQYAKEMVNAVASIYMVNATTPDPRFKSLKEQFELFRDIVSQMFPTP